MSGHRRVRLRKKDVTFARVDPREEPALARRLRVDAVGCDACGIDTNRGRCRVAAKRRPRACDGLLGAAGGAAAGGVEASSAAGPPQLVWEGSLDPDVSRPVTSFWGPLPEIFE